MVATPRENRLNHLQDAKMGDAFGWRDIVVNGARWSFHFGLRYGYCMFYLFWNSGRIYAERYDMMTTGSELSLVTSGRKK